VSKVLAQLRRGVLPLAAVALAAAAALAGGTAAAAAPVGTIRYAGSPTAVPGSYLVWRPRTWPARPH